jgi:ABC-2 type transport system ATP-binding protein
MTSALPAAVSSPPLLVVDHLRYAYGARFAVDDASLALHPGECFGLLGPNGAGKTTLLSCIAGLRGGFGGTMRWREQPFVPFTQHDQRALLGLVPQDIALYSELTARENLAFFAGIFGVAANQRAAAVAAALQLAGLVERADDRVATFSGGMKRRLNLAAATTHDPALLLLDEPTVGVDPQSRVHIFDSLLALKARGCTLLYTTHYMEEAQRLCDRVAIMHEGRVLAVGTPRELAAGAGLAAGDLEAVFLRLTGRTLRDEP